MRHSTPKTLQTIHTIRLPVFLPAKSNNLLLRCPKSKVQNSGLPFCRAFVVMKFHSESVDFVMDFCVKFFCGFLGAFRPCKRRTENPQRNPLQNSRQNPCKIHACSEKRRRKIHSAGRGARQNRNCNDLKSQ